MDPNNFESLTRPNAALCFLLLSAAEHVFATPEVTLPRWISVKRSHLRTVLWRADMQALVFHQNANNIICNIQGNIIVVLIGEKNC